MPDLCSLFERETMYLNPFDDQESDVLDLLEEQDEFLYDEEY